MQVLLRFLGGKLVSHPTSNKGGSAELYKMWVFEKYPHLNHAIWEHKDFLKDWNFAHLVYQELLNTSLVFKELYYATLWNDIEEEMLMHPRPDLVISKMEQLIDNL